MDHLAFGYGALGNLPRLRDCRVRRASSYDRSGGNADFVFVHPGETCRFGEIRGPGIVRHIWFGGGANEASYPLKVLLRAYWSSTAYWYQTEPHGQFPSIPPMADRLPRTSD